MKPDEARKAIETYIGSDLKNLEIAVLGDLLNITLSYTDNLPMYDVRHWINENIPNLWHIEIERLYSEDTIKKALLELYDEDDDIVLRVESYLLRKKIAPAHHEQAPLSN